MIKSGTRIVIDGIPYTVIESLPSSQYGKHIIIVEHDCSGTSDIRASISQVLTELSDANCSPLETSKKIISWFADSRIKSGGNIKPMLALKTNPKIAEAQIRRLLKAGEEPETILEVLSFAIASKFWIGVIECRMHRIATLTDGEVATNYDKIKAEMSRERNSEVVELVQEKPIELFGKRSYV